MHLNARMQHEMRTTIELSEPTYTRLRAKAAERGMRGFSAIVEEALERHLAPSGEDEADSALAEAEGAWSDADVEEWEKAREGAWATWPADRSSTRTS
jgi:Ribbon-helix-helix protein, copG family